MQWKRGYDHFLSSYEKFGLRNCSSKLGLKNLFLPQHLKCRCGSTATVTSVKYTWNEGPYHALQEKRFSVRNYAAYAT